MIKKTTLSFFILFFLTAGLAFFLFYYGEGGVLGGMNGDVDATILWELRIPKIVVALLTGGMLACTGLLLQVFFQNPLAGPDLLGINSGASLGVALAIMGNSFFPSSLKELSLPMMAMLGALSIFVLLAIVIRKNISSITIIIMGLLIASFTSSLISVLINLTPSLQVKNFLIWSLGSFQGVSLERLSLFAILSGVSLVMFILIPKKLNQLMIGENYAKSMGMNVRSFKMFLVFICSYTVGVVTVFCGPIGFIGIIAPHISRSVLKQSDLRIVLPASFFVGAILALFTESILIFSSDYSIGTNSILGLIGAPIIALYFYRERKFL